MRYLKITIHGKVQGVGFRHWFAQHAQQLNLTGYVQNLDNGDVEAVIVGPLNEVNDMIKLSMSGPEHAVVNQVFYEDIVDYQAYQFENFQIQK